MRTKPTLLASLVLAAGLTVPASFAAAASSLAARDSVPVVLTGAQLPTWSRDPMQDPVPTLDDDDEIVLYSSVSLVGFEDSR